MDATIIIEETHDILIIHPNELHTGTNISQIAKLHWERRSNLKPTPH